MSAHKHTERILIVDDDYDDFIITGEYIKHIPGASYKIDWCNQYNEALLHVMAGDYQLYLVDYRMGVKSGVDFLKDAQKYNCEEPIILLTGKGNYAVDLEAMQLGAVDYLIKTDLSVEKMERSIRYALERTASLKALKANERKYRSIFENSKDIVFLTDLEMNFKDVNNAVEPLLGYTKEEILKLNLSDLIEQAQHKKFLQQYLPSGKELNDWEVVLNTKNHEKKSCVLTATHEGGYLQGIIHDITHLKKAEKATLQAEKLAATGRLVRTLAHEVRNPLNNITLSVEQLQQELKDENSLLYLDIVYRNSQRINGLISELLDTSKPSEITLYEHILQAILDDVIASAVDRLTLKRIKLHVSYPDDRVIIKADREKLKIALLNLVINAIEAMEEYKGVLSILLHIVNEEAILSIHDNGCGISEENVARLFEPFYTQKRNGMGLGLAFTLNILQSHKAGIEVTSTENKGTTFIITFPIISTSNE